VNGTEKAEVAGGTPLVEDEGVFGADDPDEGMLAAVGYTGLGYADADVGVERQEVDVPEEPSAIEIEDPEPLVETPEDPNHEPYLTMLPTRRGIGKGGYLRLFLRGEEDSILAGKVRFTSSGLREREVELRGLSDPRERFIEMKVPHNADLHVTAELDGMVAQPLVVPMAGEREWVEADLLISQAPDGAHLVLALTGSVPPDGTRMWLELYPEGDELQMDLRSPVIEDGRLVVGGMTAGTTRILGMPYGAVSGRERQCLVFSIEAQLAAGERAELSAPMEMSAAILVDFDGVDLDWSPRSVQVERADGTRHTVQCQRLGMKILRGGIERTITVIPRLAPGAITLHFEDPDYLPMQHAMTVLGAKTHQVRLLLEAR